MSLPIKQTPTYELTLPSTGEIIKYRPYLISEQSLIMMAMEGDDLNEITNTLKQIVSNCVVTKPFNVDNLTMYDLEYIMLQLRSRSVSSVVEAIYKCKNITNGKVCDNEVKCSIDLNDVKISGAVPDKKIDLYDDPNLGTVGVIMKQPTVGMLKNHPLTTIMTSKGSTKMIAACIEAVYDSNTVYDTKKEKPEEVEKFLLSLTVDQFKKITQWFESLPRLKHNFTFVCNKCGYEHKMELEGLYSFFA